MSKCPKNLEQTFQSLRKVEKIEKWQKIEFFFIDNLSVEASVVAKKSWENKVFGAKIQIVHNQLTKK